MDSQQRDLVNMSSFGIFFGSFWIPFFSFGFTGLRGLRRQEVWSNCFALGFQHLGQTEPTLIEDCDVHVPRTRTSCSSEVVTWLSGLFLICFYFESTGLKMALATGGCCWNMKFLSTCEQRRTGLELSLVVC